MAASVVPESIVEAATRTCSNLENFRSHFLEFLPLCDAETLAELPPLQRAETILLLAKATTTLLTLRLRCNGIDPDDHSLKSELERLSLYEDKLQRFIGLSKEPLRRSTILNTQAATRFIEHSLPDLTPEQRQSMREISQGDDGVRMKYLERTIHKKRKYQPEKQSVPTAAKEFLEKAARELLGDNANNGFKGPLQLQPNASKEDI
ncbi:nuclear nucleic acid-binding protein C1D [Impatiens glandulifera]|uniref:nuclear nucleic acid-binding protein C1D n=1 Tax=Impatiens glandulifera TaxID=253017 RepID=UPI001FB107B9|nr:nuclear nucleic acid-binding protein C1D [Impatiens glandulifera]